MNVILFFHSNLVEFIMYREPSIIKNSFFFVDRLHIQSHTGCTSAYKLDNFDWAININSMTAEQQNSKQYKIRHLGYFLNLQHFGMLTRYSCVVYNQEKRQYLENLTVEKYTEVVSCIGSINKVFS